VTRLTRLIERLILLSYIVDGDPIKICDLLPTSADEALAKSKALTGEDRSTAASVRT